MKPYQNALKIFTVSCLFTVIFFQTLNAVAQSGRNTGIKQPPGVNNTQQLSDSSEKSNCEKLLVYRYVAPLAAKDFVRELNKLGVCGYRLEDVTHIPVTIRQKALAGDDEDIGTLKIAGIVKLSNSKYQYDVLRVETVTDLAEKLNEFSRNKFSFRELITFDGTVERFEYDDLGIRDKQFTVPQAKNLILLERAFEDTSQVREYKVLKVGFGPGKEPTETMQIQLDEAIKQNFSPIRTFLSAGFGKETILDNYQAIILEKTGGIDEGQVRFVRAALRGSFKDRVNDLAQNSFIIKSIGTNDGLMVKTGLTALPVTYIWLDSGSKKFEADLANLLIRGARFVRATAGKHGFVESALVFEQSTDFLMHYEYKTVKFADNETPFFKTTPPSESLQQLSQLTRQGFNVKEIYFNGVITVLLERKK